MLEQGGSIRAINAKGLAGKLTRKHIDKLGEVAKTYGAKGLAFSRLTEEGTSSSFEKFLTEEEKAALYKAMELETGDVLLIVSDADWVKACTALGQVRLEIGRKYGLIDPTSSTSCGWWTSRCLSTASRRAAGWPCIIRSPCLRQRILTRWKPTPVPAMPWHTILY